VHAPSRCNPASPSQIDAQRAELQGLEERRAQAAVAQASLAEAQDVLVAQRDMLAAQARGLAERGQELSAREAASKSARQALDEWVGGHSCVAATQQLFAMASSSLRDAVNLKHAHLLLTCTWFICFESHEEGDRC
jgi:hypothetical protein